MPVKWEELAKAVGSRNVGALYFKPDAAVKRIKRLGDLFAPVLEMKQKLPAAFTKALASGPPMKLSSWPRTRNNSGRDHDKTLPKNAAKGAESTKPAARSVSDDPQRRFNRPSEKTGTGGRSRHRIEKPVFVEPMQCKAVAELPEDEDWAFEIKFDGYRCVALKVGRKVTLLSRNEKKLDDRFPELAIALAELPGEFAVDGEIVALDEKGRPSFQLLQKSGSAKRVIYFYAFDLLHRDGENLQGSPIERRREMLGELLADPPAPLRLSPLLQAPAGEILEAVQKLGLEGVVGKCRGSLYEPGERTGAWIKRRINREQEFVIGGDMPGARGFDALIVGVYEKKQLTYVARVKDGFVPRTRDAIFPALKKLRIDECPFANLPEKMGSRWGEALTAEKLKDCRWVKPVLICQVAFVEWTDGGKLRHSAFVAMRDDKRPGAVVRET